jgi:hypothetical protein
MRTLLIFKSREALSDGSILGSWFLNDIAPLPAIQEPVHGAESLLTLVTDRSIIAVIN